jgi:ATP-dependent Clp protease ATP-binding subunit ClpB
MGVAEQEAKDLGDDFVSVEHYLLAAAKADKDVQAIFDRHAITHQKLLHALAQIRGSHRVTDQTPETKFQALEKYTRDLTAAARRGEIDPVIGRDSEIRRVMQVLSRRTKNNPYSSGCPGLERLPLRRALHGASPMETSQRPWRTNGSWRWTSRAWSQVRSIAASSKIA